MQRTVAAQSKDTAAKSVDKITQEEAGSKEIKPTGGNTASGGVVKIVDPKPCAVPGTSSRTATSKIDDEPYVLASRWTAVELKRAGEVKGRLRDDREEGWVVV